MDFEDDIDGFGVRLPPPSATQKLRLQTESPSNRNSGSPAARRYKKDDRMDGVGAAKTLYPPPHYDLQQCSQTTTFSSELEEGTNDNLS